MVPPAVVEVEGFTEEAAAAEDEGCVEDDGDVLFVAPPGGTLSEEQFCEPSTRGASSVFEQDVPAAASQDSPFTVLLSSLSDGWCVGVFLREASPLTTCPRAGVCPRAGLQELEGAPLSTLLEVEQEPDRRPSSVPFITLLTALDKEDSPFS